MRRRVTIVAFISLFLATAAAMAFMFIRDKPQWTTSSRESLREFEEGLADEMKMYRSDALQHYARALEIDPSFAMARMKVVQLSEGGLNLDKWRSLLESIDTEPLSPRERALVSIRLLRAQGRHADAEQVMNEYIEANPRDPHVLYLQCGLKFARQHWDEARSCYQRLLEVDPNFVVAVNHLGYISMAQERFDEAADHFETYRYIAPDQANPYDSMGELLMLRGAYEQARSHFTRAVDIRPDFCASWSHLIQLDVLLGQTERARQTLERASREANCAPEVPRLRCQVEVAHAGEDREATLEVFQEQCLPHNFTPDVLVQSHKAALLSNDRELGIDLTRQIRDLVENAEERGARALEGHMAGMELLDSRQPSLAVERLRAVDEDLIWFGETQGIFKIYNRAALVTALERSGKPEEAAQLRNETRLVNASLFDEFAQEVAQVR